MDGIDYGLVKGKIYHLKTERSGNEYLIEPVLVDEKGIQFIVLAASFLLYGTGDYFVFSYKELLSWGASIKEVNLKDLPLYLYINNKSKRFLEILKEVTA